MEFQEFTQKAWADHGGDAQGVADRLGDGLDLVTEVAQLPALAALIVHVRGEHLGQWSEGLEELRALSRHACFDSESDPGRAVYRNMAILHYCQGDIADFEDCLERGQAGGEHPRESCAARAYAIIASTLAGQARIEDARVAFDRALECASYGPQQGDPAALALAITGNNLACTLEEKEDRSDAETELMKIAALTGRKYWEVAGDWKNVERAEYRLAMTMIAAGEAEAAIQHASNCLSICEDNDADACERFFAQEALSLSHHTAGHTEEAAAARTLCADLLGQQEENMLAWCKTTLEKLDARLGVT